MRPSLRAPASVIAKSAAVKAKAASLCVRTSDTSTGTTRRITGSEPTSSPSSTVPLKTSADSGPAEPLSSSLSSYSLIANANLHSPSASQRSRLIQPKVSASTHKSQRSDTATKSPMNPPISSTTSKSVSASPVERQNLAPARERMLNGRFIEYTATPLESANANSVRGKTRVALPEAKDAFELRANGKLAHCRTDTDDADRAPAELSPSSLGTQTRASSSLDPPSSRLSAPESTTLRDNDDQDPSEHISRSAGISKATTVQALPIAAPNFSDVSEQSGDHSESHAAFLEHSSNFAEKCLSARPPLAASTHNSAEYCRFLPVNAEPAVKQSPKVQASGRGESPLPVARSLPTKHLKKRNSDTAPELPVAEEAACVSMSKQSDLSDPHVEAIPLANPQPALPVEFAGSSKGEGKTGSGGIRRRLPSESAKVRFKRRSLRSSLTSDGKPQQQATRVASASLVRKERLYQGQEASQPPRCTARRELSECADSVASLAAAFTTTNIISWAAAKGVDQGVIRALEKNAVDGSILGKLHEEDENIFKLFNFSQEKKQKVLDVAIMFRADCDQLRRVVPIICGLDAMAEDIGALVARDTFIERLKHISAAEHPHGLPRDARGIWTMFAGSSESIPFKDFARVMGHYNGVLGNAFPLVDEAKAADRVDQLLSHVTKLNHLLDNVLADNSGDDAEDTDAQSRDAVSVISQHTQGSRAFGERFTEVNFLALTTKMTEMAEKFQTLREEDRKEDNVQSDTVGSAVSEDDSDRSVSSFTQDAQQYARDTRLNTERHTAGQLVTENGSFEELKKSHDCCEQGKKYLSEIKAATQALRVTARESQFECAVALSPAVAEAESSPVLQGRNDGEVVTNANVAEKIKQEDLEEKLEQAVKALQCLDVTARAILPKQGLGDDHTQVTELKDHVKRLMQQVNTVLSRDMQQPCVVQQQECAMSSDYTTLCAPLGIHPPRISLRALSPKDFGIRQSAFSARSEGGLLTPFPADLGSVVPSIGASRRKNNSLKENGCHHVPLSAAQHSSTQVPAHGGGCINKQVHFVVQQQQKVNVQWDVNVARQGKAPSVSVSPLVGAEVE